MSVEDINLWDVAEQWWTKEVSEKEQKKVKEDWKKAKQAHKKIKAQQQEWKKLALFLSKVLGKYYNNSNIINCIHSMLENISIEEKNLYIIFSPFIEHNIVFNKVSEYIKYLKSKLGKVSEEKWKLIFFILEEEKLWWDIFWDNLKSWKSKITYKQFKNEILDELSN